MLKVTFSPSILAFCLKLRFEVTVLASVFLFFISSNVRASATFCSLARSASSSDSVHAGTIASKLLEILVSPLVSVRVIVPDAFSSETGRVTVDLS